MVSSAGMLHSTRATDCRSSCSAIWRAAAMALDERQGPPSGGGSVGARHGQPGLVGEDDELGSIARVKLDHRAADVGLGRRARDDQLLPYLVVGQPLGHERDDLTLASGELIEQIGVRDL